jgi:cytidylate kinase
MAPDAHLIDTTALSIRQVVDEILSIARAAL